MHIHQQQNPTAKTLSVHLLSHYLLHFLHSRETIEECFEEYDLDVDDSPNVLGYQISKKDSM